MAMSNAWMASCCPQCLESLATFSCPPGYWPEQAYPQFRMAFKEGTSCFSPNAFSSLQRLVKEESRGLGLRPALALLRLSQHDPDVFYKFKQVTYHHIHDDLELVTRKVWRLSANGSVGLVEKRRMESVVA